MTIRNEIQQLIQATKQHLREEEELPPWEVCSPTTHAFYKNPTPKAPVKPMPAPVAAKPPVAPAKPPIASPKPTPTPSSKSLPPPPPVAEIEAPAPLKKKAPVNHEMFKSLCKELFPNLKIVNDSSSLPSKVQILYDNSTSDKALLFLEKIGEALRDRGIETTLTASANFVSSPQTLILADSKLVSGLQSSPIIPLENLDLLADDTIKKKLLWQQLRTLLGI